LQGSDSRSDNVFAAENGVEHTEIKFGLMKASNHPLAKIHDVYFVEDKKLGKVVIDCNPSSNSLPPTCEVFISVTEGLIFAYRFHRDLLPEWRSIHEHVTDFINSSLRKG
jgi:hypothetical protein